MWQSKVDKMPGRVLSLARTRPWKLSPPDYLNLFWEYHPLRTSYSARLCYSTLVSHSARIPGINYESGLNATLQRPPHPTTSHPSPPSSSSYSPPRTGILSYLPARLIPYGELIRFHKPAGSIYLYQPYLYGTLLASCLESPIVTSPSHLLATNLYLFAGAVLIRGGACAWNDLLDRDVDPHVTRTRHRPMARGAISPRQSMTFIGAHFVVGGAMLAQMPSSCLYYSIPFLAGAGLYPLMKRITNYPQVFLGFVYSYGAVMAFPALGVDLTSSSPVCLGAAACLYLSGVAWTVLGDWIYACQDVKDDVKVGVRSIAVSHAAHAKTALAGLALVQSALLTLVGVIIDAGQAFYLTPLTTLATSGFMIRRVDLQDPGSCGWWFSNAWWVVGSGMASGFVGEYVARRRKTSNDNGSDGRMGGGDCEGRLMMDGDGDGN